MLMYTREEQNQVQNTKSQIIENMNRKKYNGLKELSNTF